MPGITAPQTYQPFDIVYCEEAFAWVVEKKNRDECCDYCCKSSENLIPCEECKEIKYCGTECKEKNEFEHRMECANLHKLDDQMRFSDDFIRLVARVIFKVKDKDWKKITRNVMGKDVSFEDVDSHYKEMTTNPRLFLLYKAVKESLKYFIGEENLPEEDQLIKIVGKIRFSSDSLSSNADLFCFGMSLFEHECIPNCNIDSAGTVMKIWANKKIYKDVEKITVSTRSILTTNFVRSPLSSDRPEVFCSCTECSLPYGQSVLTKVINEKEAYGVIRLSESVLKKSEVLSDLDLEENPILTGLLDHTLNEHEGVLGDTNALHLKLLAIKALTMGGTHSEKRMHLKELEKHVSNVFGEFSLELSSIFKSLAMVNFKLGNLLEATLYMKKVQRLQVHQS